MKKITCFALALAGLMAVPASAAEVGLLIDKQIGQSVEVAGSGFKVNSVSPTGFGIRGAYTLLDLKVAELGISGTYHSKAEADLEFDAGPVGIRSGKVGSQYMAIGAQVDWKFLVNLHVGVDMRREKISNDAIVMDIGGTPHLLANAGDTTFNRVWLKAGIGFSIPLPVVSPFVRLEAAYATKKYDDPQNVSNADDFRKAMAPRYQVALYGGIRF